MYSVLVPAMLLFAAPDVAEADAAAWWSAIGLSANLDTTIGVGSFVADRHADDPYYLSTLSLAPSYAIDEHMSVGLGLSMYYEWTHLVAPCHAASGPRPAGGPAKDCSDTSDPNGQRFEVEDLELSFSHDQIYSLFEIDLSGDTSIALPTSRASQAASNVLTWSLGAALSRALGPVTPTISGRFTKFFPSQSAPTLGADDTSFTDQQAADGIPVGRCPSFRSDNCLALSGFVPNWRVSAKLSLGVDIPWLEGLSITVQLGYSYSRAFGTGGDALSSTKTDVSGARIVDGVNDSDNTSGLLEISYSFLDHWQVALGSSSQQPARTADGKSIRFPFFDVVSPANNYTGLYFNLAYSL